MLEAIRPGLGEPADPAPSAGAMLHHAPLDRDVFAGTKSRLTGLPALLAASALHGLVLVAALAVGSDPIGAGGTDLDALSVEVALVSASALESRASLAVEAVASAAAIEQTEGAIQSAPAIDAPSTPDFAEKAEPELQHRNETPQAKPAKDPASDPPADPLPTLALTIPGPTPTEVEAVALPVREPEPKPVQPKLVERLPPPNSTASLAAPTGGATSHATDGVNRRAQAAAAVSAGSVRTFTKGVVDALGKTRPKGLRHRARGTASVAFAIAEGGGLEFVRVAKSSGHDALDDAAISAVRNAAFPVPPYGMTLAQRTYQIPYHFR